jgi:hypothetical protein
MTYQPAEISFEAVYLHARGGVIHGENINIIV